MTDAHHQLPAPDDGETGTGPEPRATFEVPPSGGANFLPPDPTAETAVPDVDWIVPATDPTGAGLAGGDPASPDLAGPDPTVPGAAWGAAAGAWAAPASSWDPPGAGWTPPATGWAPPGAGWAPSGAGWMPPGGGWVPPGGPWPPQPPAPRRRSRVVAFAVVVAVVVLLLGVGLGYAVRSPGPATTAPSSSGSGSSGSGSSGYPQFPGGSGTSGTGSSGSGGSTSSSAGSPSDISALASEVDPDLVDINTTLKDENEEAAGTGMVLTASGEVLTNNHVIEGATSITATDVGTGKTYTATVVGYDRTDDVAVIQLQGASGLKTVSIGNSSDVASGQGVVGIGNAGGVGGTPSTAGGSITALNQSITASDDGDGTSEKLNGLIETNCNIQPGDSGGPLVNTSGQVVGMDTAASEGSGSEGEFAFRTGTTSTTDTDQGYSIPINEAITLAKKIVAGDSSSTIHIGKTAFLGVEVTGSASTNTTGSGSSPFGTGRFSFGTGGTSTSGSSTTAGADVAGVLPGTPAAQAGLAKGDVITTFAGTAITSATALTSVINGYHPGDNVKVTWVNASGQSQSATVTMANGPAA